MRKMNGLQLDMQTTMRSKKLPIYQFDNGSKVCNASLYNLYDALKLLGMLHNDDKSYETMCWVRDYVDGHTIETVEQLERMLLNEKIKLRISFFSYKISSIEDLVSFAKRGSLPVVDEHPNTHSYSEVHKEELYVYTIWFAEGKNYDVPTLSKSNIKNTRTLFDRVKSAYQMLLAPSSPRTPSPDLVPELKNSEVSLRKNFPTLKSTSDGTTPKLTVNNHTVSSHIRNIISLL